VFKESHIFCKRVFTDRQKGWLQIMVNVSIIVPVYNVESYLRECMDSILGQSLKDIEVICVNDGSTDSSLDILREYAQKDARIRLISKANSGYGNTMNVGIDAALGEYVGIVEPDDYVAGDMYKRLYETAKQYDLDIIKSDFYKFRGTADRREYEYIHLSQDLSYYGKILDPKENIEIFMFVMNTWTGIYKREFLERYHIRHNETPGASFQDNGFWFQTFCLAQRVYFLAEPFYMNRRDNPGSSVHSRDKVYSACEEYEFIYHFLEKNPELKERFLNIYALKRFHNYQFTMKRIGKEYHREFLMRYSRDFREAERKGELSKEYFKENDWCILQQIMKSPQKYYKKFYGKGSICSRVIYYLKWFGVRKTCLKIIKTIYTGVWRHVKGIRDRSSL